MDRTPIAINNGHVIESDDDFDPRSDDSSVMINNARNGPPVTPKRNVFFDFLTVDIIGAIIFRPLKHFKPIFRQI